VWNKRQALSPHHRTIAEILSEKGYETAAFSNNPHVAIKTGFGRGFDVFEELFRVRKERTLLNLIKRVANRLLLTVFKFKYAGAYQTNRTIKRWLANRPDQQRPFFLFVNYMEPHEPYQPPWPYRSRFMDQRVKKASKTRLADYWGKRVDGMPGQSHLSDWDIEVDVALYDAELAFLDAQLSSLSGYMERAGLLDNALLIITADHGQHLGENGQIGHGATCVYEPVARVPLVLCGPGIVPAGRRISQPVQLVDIAPTILSVLGHQPEHNIRQWQGKSLLPQDIKDLGRPFTIVHSRRRVQSGQEQEWIAIRTEDYKYIWNLDGQDALFHLQKDPGEVHNLIDQRPAEASELRTHLVNWLESNGPLQDGDQDYTPVEVELDKEIEDRLRALGYIG
jgi:arylsulfatase A-like enzyme